LRYLVPRSSSGTSTEFANTITLHKDVYAALNSNV
jgi:hypothetical protein